MGRVSGKVAIVTGGASGIGVADANLLVAEGAQVVIADLNETDGEALAQSLGENAVFFKHNVADEASWQAIIEFTEEKFGGLDVLVNNAGIMKMGGPVDTTLEDWRAVMAVNADGVFLGCKHALPALEKRGGGSIVNISSIAAVHGMSYFTAYGASKAAVRSLTKSVGVHCREAKNNVRCNSIHPDGVKTPMVAKVATGKDTATREEIEQITAGSDRMCEPEDIASVVLFLASDDSRYINGEQIMVDNAASVTPPPISG